MARALDTVEVDRGGTWSKWGFALMEARCMSRYTWGGTRVALRCSSGSEITTAQLGEDRVISGDWLQFNSNLAGGGSSASD